MASQPRAQNARSLNSPKSWLLSSRLFFNQPLIGFMQICPSIKFLCPSNFKSHRDTPRKIQRHFVENTEIHNWKIPEYSTRSLLSPAVIQRVASEEIGNFRLENLNCLSHKSRSHFLKNPNCSWYKSGSRCCKIEGKFMQEGLQMAILCISVQQAVQARQGRKGGRDGSRCICSTLNPQSSKLSAFSKKKTFCK